MRQRARLAALKDAALERYGRSCSCCGLAVAALLTLDHIVAVGREKGVVRPTGHKLYQVLKDTDWPDGYQTLCFSCNSAKHGHRAVCPHQETPATPTGSNLVNLRCKTQTMQEYGGGVCGCCGESDIYALTLHHVNGDGKKHRADTDSNVGSHFYRRLRQLGWPTDVPLEVKCTNCNYGVDLPGGCPCEGHHYGTELPR